MYDYNKNGALDSNGKLRVLNGFDAVSQAISNWIHVALSERIMYPEEGNNVIYFLGKKMNSDTISELESRIQTGISEDFGNFVTVKDASILPVPEEATLQISVTVTWQQTTATVTTNLTV